MNGRRLESALQLTPCLARDAEDASADRLLAMASAPAQDSAELRLATGHVVRADAMDRSRITVQAPDGTVQLRVAFTPDGPVLSFAAAALELTAQREVRIDCDRFDLRTRERIVLQSDGDIEQAAGRDALLHAGRNLTTAAREVNLVAHDGSVAIEASEDVDVQGAKILLNC
jgi:uncharacterized protein (DUF2345 family)